MVVACLGRRTGWPGRDEKKAAGEETKRSRKRERASRDRETEKRGMFTN